MSDSWRLFTGYYPQRPGSSPRQRQVPRGTREVAIARAASGVSVAPPPPEALVPEQPPAEVEPGDDAPAEAPSA